MTKKTRFRGGKGQLQCLNRQEDRLKMHKKKGTMCTGEPRQTRGTRTISTLLISNPQLAYSHRKTQARLMCRTEADSLKSLYLTKEPWTPNPISILKLHLRHWTSAKISCAFHHSCRTLFRLTFPLASHCCSPLLLFLLECSPESIIQSITHLHYYLQKFFLRHLDLISTKQGCQGGVTRIYLPPKRWNPFQFNSRGHIEMVLFLFCTPQKAHRGRLGNWSHEKQTGWAGLLIWASLKNQMPIWRIKKNLKNQMLQNGCTVAAVVLPQQWPFHAVLTIMCWPWQKLNLSRRLSQLKTVCRALFLYMVDIFVSFSMFLAIWKRILFFFLQDFPDTVSTLLLSENIIIVHLLNTNDFQIVSRALPL